MSDQPASSGKNKGNKRSSGKSSGGSGKGGKSKDYNKHVNQLPDLLDDVDVDPTLDQSKVITVSAVAKAPAKQEQRQSGKGQGGKIASNYALSSQNQVGTEGITNMEVPGSLGQGSDLTEEQARPTYLQSEGSSGTSMMNNISNKKQATFAGSSGSGNIPDSYDEQQQGDALGSMVSGLESSMNRPTGADVSVPRPRGDGYSFFGGAKPQRIGDDVDNNTPGSNSNLSARGVYELQGDGAIDEKGAQMSSGYVAGSSGSSPQVGYGGMANTTYPVPALDSFSARSMRKSQQERASQAKKDEDKGRGCCGCF
ncbi:unnamed protein product [Amoebophrya sp. A25]|nr:unnamed protein product [Amoebophrya sp. A25]|eukprot:GSA25T00020621001.1